MCLLVLLTNNGGTSIYRICSPSLVKFCLQVVVKSSNVYPKDSEAPPCGVDDMTKLAYLHEPGVLSNLKSRYDINEIYVSSASFLVPWSFN